MFQYEVSTSVETLEKQLPCKANFRNFLPLNFSNFRVKWCERPNSYQNCQKSEAYRDMQRVKIKKLFPETIIYKILETNPGFHVKYTQRENFNFCFSRVFY